MSYKPGDIIPSHFDPRIVAGAYIASLTGCYLTIELLHRRGTGLSNLRSWIDTLVCATALGLVGIWCMHFIGNRAIILGNGNPDIQLVYDPGYSVLSVFLPIIGLTIAFSAAEYPFRSPTMHWAALICTGVFAGLSIVGMHYMGNFGISNYHLNYVPRFLAASIIIAIGDCLIVHILFYTWRDKWISDWRKRALCAIFLAAGVSAMHFTAATNCIYSFETYSSLGARRSRDLQVSIAGALCGAAVAIAVTMLSIFRRRAARRKKSSRKVMVSCAMFDADGRILVTTEGVLPSREITDKFSPYSFDEDFDRAHPAFHWMFRVTRNWFSVSELIPKMDEHLSTSSANGELWAHNSTASRSHEIRTIGSYSLLFRERFCVAAASLASTLHLPVEKIGVLYDNIIDTGTISAAESSSWRHSAMPLNGHDLEAGDGVADELGRGQLLFLTRSLSTDDADKLINAGFRFGSMNQVGRNIAQNMQISLTSLEAHMTSLQRYNHSLTTLSKTGTWLSCFAMIPKLGSKGFDIAVKKSDQDQLPDVQLLPFQPLTTQIEFVERMHGKTTAQCLAFLKNRDAQDVDRTPEQQHFALIVLPAIVTLEDQLPSSWLQNARFYGKPVYPHYTRPLCAPSPVTTMYSFVVCADLHTSIDSYPSMTRAPLSFFSVRHQCYSDSPHQLEQIREVHREFGPLLARMSTKDGDKAKKISIHMAHGAVAMNKVGRVTSPRPSSTIHGRLDSASADDMSTKSACDSIETPVPELPASAYDRTSHAVLPALGADQPWGGILVNSDTVVERDDNASKTGVSMEVAVGTAETQRTFVDELCAFAKATMTGRCSV